MREDDLHRVVYILRLENGLLGEIFKYRIGKLASEVKVRDWRCLRNLYGVCVCVCVCGCKYFEHRALTREAKILMNGSSGYSLFQQRLEVVIYRRNCSECFSSTFRYFWYRAALRSS